MRGQGSKIRARAESQAILGLLGCARKQRFGNPRSGLKFSRVCDGGVCFVSPAPSTPASTGTLCVNRGACPSTPVHPDPAVRAVAARSFVRRAVLTSLEDLPSTPLRAEVVEDVANDNYGPLVRASPGRKQGRLYDRRARMSFRFYSPRDIAVSAGGKLVLRWKRHYRYPGPMFGKRLMRDLRAAVFQRSQRRAAISGGAR